MQVEQIAQLRGEAEAAAAARDDLAARCEELQATLRAQDSAVSDLRAEVTAREEAASRAVAEAEAQTDAARRDAEAAAGQLEEAVQAAESCQVMHMFSQGGDHNWHAA